MFILWALPILNCRSTPLLRIKCPQCNHMVHGLKTHPVAGGVCPTCMDKLSVLGDIAPPGRSASKRDPVLDFDDLGLPDNDTIGVRGSRLHATDAPGPCRILR